MKDKILKKLDDMNRYIDELSQLIPGTENEYLESLERRRACEKTMELIIDTMIDISSIIISSKNMGAPSDEDNIFDKLEKNDVIPKNFAKRLKEIKGFRNILVHRYGEIDDKRAYILFSEEIQDFEKFRNYVTEYLGI
ncbi:MAG: type VII toxin-antitoxin system HepT family RNase toxin [Nanobdellota archaeon]